jgi:hypothetical protein
MFKWKETELAGRNGVKKSAKTLRAEAQPCFFSFFLSVSFFSPLKKMTQQSKKVMQRFSFQFFYLQFFF